MISNNDKTKRRLPKYLDPYWKYIKETLEEDKSRCGQQKKRMAYANNGVLVKITFIDDDVGNTIAHLSVNNVITEEKVFCIVARKELEQWIYGTNDCDETESLVGEIVALIDEIGLTRDVFMKMFRHSTQLREYMTEEDRRDVFLNVLRDKGDISCELIRTFCKEYEIPIRDVWEND